MQRTFATLLFALSCGLVLAQSSEQRKFEVSDVHGAAPTSLRGMVGPIIRSTRYEVRNVSLVELIALANSTEPDFVYGGPSWIGNNRYDVVAKVPAGTSQDDAKLMLQDLLAQRFGAQTHRDKKSLSVFVLSLGKGKPKLRAATGEGESGCHNPYGDNPLPAGEEIYLHVSCRNMNLPAIVRILRADAAGYLTRTLVDATKLEGLWDFDIKWTARNRLPGAGADGISIFDAVDKQLGLKLELQNYLSDVVVVDNVNDKPTDNAIGAAEAVPEPPKEFEVASIKPAAPGSEGTRIRFMAGGRVDAEASLRDLIIFALDVPPNLSADLIANAPDFLDHERYAIVAKAPMIGGPESLPPPSEIQAMFRALIVDQFNLKTHQETREATVFALLAAKAENKLKKANPSVRGNCVLDVASGKSIGTPGAYLCQNTTMPDLAKLLQEHANAYTVHPVVNVTGIIGGWDFSIGWTPLAQLKTTDAFGLSLFEAVDKQLGLKLEQQKRPILVTVIDHVDRTPKQ